MNNKSTALNLSSGYEKTEQLIRMAKEGLRSGANEEVFPWQFMSEFDCESCNGLREELIYEFGGEPFTRQSWDQYGGWYCLDDEEKNRYGNSYKEYADYCFSTCHDIFREILDSLDDYKQYLDSLAKAAE